MDDFLKLLEYRNALTHTVKHHQTASEVGRMAQEIETVANAELALQTIEGMKRWQHCISDSPNNMTRTSAMVVASLFWVVGPKPRNRHAVRNRVELGAKDVQLTDV